MSWWEEALPRAFCWLLSPVSPVGTNTCSSHGSSEDQCSYLLSLGSGLSLSSSLREVCVLSTIPEALPKPINLFYSAPTRLLSTMSDEKQNKLRSHLWWTLVGSVGQKWTSTCMCVCVLQMHVHTGTLTHIHTHIFFIRLRTYLYCLSISILPCCK